MTLCDGDVSVLARQAVVRIHVYARDGAAEALARLVHPAAAP